MGVVVSSEAFTPSVTFITTDDQKGENEARFPAVGAHSGAWEEARPGCSVKRVRRLESDLRGSQTSQGTSRLAVAQRASKSGILRTRRIVL